MEVLSKGKNGYLKTSTCHILKNVLLVIAILSLSSPVKHLRVRDAIPQPPHTASGSLPIAIKIKPDMVLQHIQDIDKAKADKKLADEQAAAQAAVVAQQQAEAQAAAQAPAQPVVVAHAIGRPNNYEYGSCTWYVASQINVPDTLGNANTWAYYAGLLGYTVSTVPKVGAVAQSTAGVYGHVAIVVAISDGQVELSEMNVVGSNIVDIRWIPLESYAYIYF